MKTCSKCHIEQTTDQFTADKRRPDGLRMHCKSCVKAYRQANSKRFTENTKRWKEANKEQQIAYRRSIRTEIAEKNRRYYQENKERLAEKQKEYRAACPESLRAAKHRRRARQACAVPQRWLKSECPDTNCYWCGVDLSTTETHLDHLMPISLGGEAKKYNEANACAACNLAKNNKHPLVFIAEQF